MAPKPHLLGNIDSETISGSIRSHFKLPGATGDSS